MGEAIIEVESLVKAFKGDVRALDGLSLAVPPGSVYGLLGPNGAGKTTLIRVLATLLPSDGGTARVAGVDVPRRPGRGARPDRAGRPVRGRRRGPHRPQERRAGRPALRAVPPPGAPACQPGAGAHSPGGGGRPPGQDLLGWDAP